MQDEPSKHLIITVQGHVQGVFFRKSALEKARHLNLTGYVKNQPDGTVLIEAEGKNDALAELLDWCEVGPLKAQVTDITVKEGSLQKYKTFQISY